MRRKTLVAGTSAEWGSPESAESHVGNGSAPMRGMGGGVQMGAQPKHSFGQFFLEPHMIYGNDDHPLASGDTAKKAKSRAAACCLAIAIAAGASFVGARAMADATRAAAGQVQPPRSAALDAISGRAGQSASASSFGR